MVSGRENLVQILSMCSLERSANELRFTVWPFWPSISQTQNVGQPLPIFQDFIFHISPVEDASCCPRTNIPKGGWTHEGCIWIDPDAFKGKGCCLNRKKQIKLYVITIVDFTSSSSKSSPNTGLSPSRAKRPSYQCVRLIKAEHSMMLILSSFRRIVSHIHPSASAS